MRQVLTLIAGPAASLDSDHVAAAVEALQRRGATAAPVEWLRPERACDVFCEFPEGQARGPAPTVIAGPGVDAVLQPAAGRRKQLLVADMESTVIANEMLDELADFAGVHAEVAAITARAMNGELDFRAALSARVGLLSGLPVEVLERARTRIRIDPGAAVLVATMRAHGARTALVSGGFDVFVEPVRRQLGFDVAQANRLEIAGGALTGRVLEPVLDRDAKLRALEGLCRDAGLDTAQTLAVGDGANDLPMLVAAGTGVAFHAKPAVAAASRHRIDHADLTALLYLQGYRYEQFQGGMR